MGEAREDLRVACHGLWKVFHDHPSYVCYGTDPEEREIRIYTVGPLPGVPAAHGGWPVVCLPIESQRFHRI